MRLKNIELMIKTDDINSIPIIYEKLSNLNLSFEAPLDEYNKEYQNKMHKGILNIHYSPNGRIEKKLKGDVIILRREQEDMKKLIPQVYLNDLDKFCRENSGYSVNFIGDQLNIISKDKKPIRYSIV